MFRWCCSSPKRQHSQDGRTTVIRRQPVRKVSVALKTGTVASSPLLERIQQFQELLSTLKDYKLFILDVITLLWVIKKVCL